MIRTLIVWTVALGAGAEGAQQAEMLPAQAAAEQAPAAWAASPAVVQAPAAWEAAPGAVSAEPARPQPLRGLAVGLYRLWKPVSPLGWAYRPGEFPYRSWYKHPYLVYRGNFFQGRYDYHRLFNYPWHAPVAVPARFLPAAGQAMPGLVPEGAILVAPSGAAQPAPQGQSAAPEHPDAAVPQ